MNTTFFLVRHAAHDRVGTVLCGRMSGVSLGSHGHAQALQVAERLAKENVALVVTSPLERARETAEPIATRAGCRLETCESLNEIDFGAWTGVSFEALEADPLWGSWNSARSVSRPPGGEAMVEAQLRIVTAIEQLRKSHSDQAVVLVSHGDVIKAALLYYLGLSIDAYTRFDIDPASVTTLLVSDWGPKVLRLNEGCSA